jgi:hypothetical protein
MGMGYFGKQVGRPVGAGKPEGAKDSLATEKLETKAHFGAQVGKLPAKVVAATVARCPRCNGELVEDDGLMRCGGRCGRQWVAGGVGRWLDPATLPFGVCACCRPRVALVAAEVGAICPESHAEYLVLPEGVKARAEVAPLGICRCCLPPQPLVKGAAGLTCRNKPQQHYGVEQGEVVWLGLAPTTNQALDQASVTAAIDAALAANNAELTLFGLFAPPASSPSPTGGR